MTLAQQHRDTILQFNGHAVAKGSYDWAYQYHDNIIPCQGDGYDARRPGGWVRRRGMGRELERMGDQSIQFYWHGEPSVRFYPDGTIDVEPWVSYSSAIEVARLTDSALWVAPYKRTMSYLARLREGRYWDTKSRNVLQIGFNIIKMRRVEGEFDRYSQVWEYASGAKPMPFPVLDRAKARELAGQYNIPDMEAMLLMAHTIDPNFLDTIEYEREDMDTALEYAKEDNFLEAAKYLPLCQPQVFGYASWRAPAPRLTPHSLTKLRQYLYTEQGGYTMEKREVFTWSEWERALRLTRLL